MQGWATWAHGLPVLGPETRREGGAGWHLPSQGVSWARSPWGLPLGCPGSSGGGSGWPPRLLLSHLADPAEPPPLPTCSQVERVPEGRPGSCLLEPAVTFPGTPCPASSPFSWGGPAPWDPRTVGAPRLCPAPGGLLSGEVGGPSSDPHRERPCRSGVLLQTPTKSGPAGPLGRKTSCFHPGLRNKLCVFGNRQDCQGSECVWQAVGSG